MLKMAQKIAHHNHRFTLIILIDMIFCAFKYGAGYMDYFEFEFYLLKGKERKTYLTSALNNQIIAKYNQKEERIKFSDKLKFNQLFQKYLHREYLDLKKCSFQEFQDFCQGKKEIVGKVIDSCGGKGVSIYNLSSYPNRKELYETLLSKKQFLVEEKIKQHPKMANLYEGSVNTLRVISFRKEDGESVILNTVIKIGNGGTVDNFSSGGMYSFVSDDGKIIIPAIDEEGKIFQTHPLSQTKIVGFQIPYFEEVKSLIQEISCIVPQVRYVGWDIAIGEKGPVLIEGNEYSGVFQMKPSLSGQKEGLLPKYRKYMDI